MPLATAATASAAPTRVFRVHQTELSSANKARAVPAIYPSGRAASFGAATLLSPSPLRYRGSRERPRGRSGVVRQLLAAGVILGGFVATGASTSSNAVASATEEPGEPCSMCEGTDAPSACTRWSTMARDVRAADTPASAFARVPRWRTRGASNTGDPRRGRSLRRVSGKRPLEPRASHPGELLCRDRDAFIVHFLGRSSADARAHAR